VPDPRVTSPELFDLRRPDAPIPQFVNAMKMAGIEITAEQVAQGITFKTMRDSNGKRIIIATWDFIPLDESIKFLEGPVPFFVAQEYEDGKWHWEQAHISNLASAIGTKSVVYVFWQKLEDPRYTEFVLKVANKVRIGAELFNRNIYNQSFDWRKVLNRWDEVSSQIAVGTIPFETEVFDRTWLDRTNRLLKFAESHGLPVAGSGFLFWRDDIPEFIYTAGFSPEEQRRLFEFMAKVKVLKFKRRITEWTVTSELGASELWAPDKYKQLYNVLGGRKFIRDLFFWANEVDPDAKLILAEDYILDANNDAVRQSSAQFFTILAELKSYDTPIDCIDLENNFWIYAPPDREEMARKLKQIQEMGFCIAAPETTIAISKVWPIWEQRPKTVNRVTNEMIAQAQIAANMTRVYLEAKGEIGFFSGTDNITWFNETGYPQSMPEIFDNRMQPKIAYYAVLQEIIKYMWRLQP
jgi:GH35 family endo-1,4-beta-xylanase